MKNIQSFEDFQNRVANDAQLQTDLKNDPVGTLQKLNYTPQSDPWLFRGVVYSLGFAVLIIVIGVMVLMIRSGGLDDTKVPTLLTALGSAAIGALAGLLAPSPKQS